MMWRWILRYLLVRLSIQGDPSGTFPVFDQGGGKYAVNSLYDIHPLALGDLMAFIEANPPKIPIDQVTGFTQVVPFTATPIQTEETTTSLTYADLTTVGPTLSNLPDGTYMVAWGAAGSVSNPSFRAKMGVSINSAAVDDTKAASCTTQGSSGMSYMTSLVLSAGTGGNSIKAKYRSTSTSATALFGNRFLTAIRVTGP